jgi:hypothetical protein
LKDEKSEPQNIEDRISNAGVKTSTDRLRDSIFLVRYSSFEWSGRRRRSEASRRLKDL